MLCFVEFDTRITEKVLALGVDKSLFVLENPAFACAAGREGEHIVLTFDEGARLLFADEDAAADFLYMVICHCKYLQMLITDFGGMMDILSGGVIHSTDWENREELPFFAPVLCTNVLPDIDDPEVTFQIMNDCDDILMERFDPSSQLIMIFGDVEREHRKLFWTA